VPWIEAALLWIELRLVVNLDDAGADADPGAKGW